MELTQDDFLAGALKIWQPKDGYRAATDPVFLAASVGAKSGQSVLELGCGVGVASLCLAQRIKGLNITGLEVQAEYAELARRNATDNQIDMSVVHGDLLNMPRVLLDQSFDHVLFNPPFYDATSVTTPDDVGRAVAHVTALSLSDWVRAGLKRLKSKGRLTFIHRVEALPEALAVLQGVAGDISIKPIAAREGRAAKRIIVTCKKGSHGPTKLLTPFIVHAGSGHVEGGLTYNIRADNILRNGASLPME